MKMNMVIGKKQLVLASLVVGLSLAVYLNWQFSGVNGDFTVSDMLGSDKIYGETVLTGTSPTGECELLINARITRDSARAEALEALNSIMTDTSLSADEITSLKLKAETISANIEKESKAETIIKAKGMNAVVYITDDKADITVQSENGLTQTEAVQIQEAVISQCGIKAEKIVIVEVK